MEPSDYGAFENEEAIKWVHERLWRCDDLRPVNAALARVVNPTPLEADVPLSSFDCRAAVAAAEIVAAFAGRPRDFVPDDVARWIVDRSIKAERTLVATASQAVERLLREPAMQSCWQHPADFEAWRGDMTDLQNRLDDRSPPEQTTLTLGDDARASNPGRAKINPWRWIRYYPTWPIIMASLVPLTIARALYAHGERWDPLYAVILNIFYWFRVREHFAHGDCNPGIVVSVTPPRLAVATNLTKGSGYFPALKIIRCPLKRSGGRRALEIGLTMPTVALYVLSPAKQGSWATFIPRPLECATDDPAAYHAAVGSFTDHDYAFLRELVENAPSLKPGLYRFDRDTLKPLRK